VKKVLDSVWDYLMLIGISGVIVAFDQWTKYLVRTRLELGESWAPNESIGQFIRIVHWKNTGAAFGIFPQGGTVFTIIAILVAVAILYYWPKVDSSQVALRLALAMQLGGAIGNLASRLGQGIVTDFISVGSFPVFNVADSSISVGVAILIVATWMDERKRRQVENEQDEKGATVEREEKSPEVDATG
jgi:signal peptidase II